MSDDTEWLNTQLSTVNEYPQTMIKLPNSSLIHLLFNWERRAGVFLVMKYLPGADHCALCSISCVQI